MPKKKTSSRKLTSSKKKVAAKAADKSLKLDLVLPGFARYFFILATVAVIGLFLWVISPFFNVLVYSALIAVVFYPLQRFFLKIFRGQRSVSAVFTTGLVIVLLLAPLFLFTVFIAQEAVTAYEILEGKIEVVDFGELTFETIEDVPFVGEALLNLDERYGVTNFIEDFDVDLIQVVKDAAESVSTFIFNQTADVLKGLGDTMLSIFILLLTVFFFFRDGEQVKDMFKALSPLPPKYEDEIEHKLKKTTYGIVLGNFGTAILQGIVGGIGFWIVGFEHVIFWATMMAFASLIPYIGTALVWVPVVIYMLFQQDFMWALFLMAWGVLILAWVDNIARPYLIGSSTKMHPLATFLAVLGGIYVFGMPGIIFGPLILSLTVTIVHIYELEYKDMLKS
jgi:predicted PurR-regulated permease PerM